MLAGQPASNWALSRAEVRANRGAATAAAGVSPKSTSRSTTCSTVVMMVALPGEPNPTTGRPSRSSRVGVMLDRGRRKGATSFGANRGLAEELATAPAGTRLKSVSSLFSISPQPGTMMPLPQAYSMVLVTTTILPWASITLKCVVLRPFSSSPGSTSAGAACAPILAARVFR